MKIAYIALRGIPLSDGIAKYTDELARKLTDKGHQITVYTTNHYGNSTGIFDGSYNIIALNVPRNKYLDKMILVFLASIHQIFFDYDIVHYHAMGPSIFSFIARLCGKKVVVQSHGVEYRRAKWGKSAQLVLKTLEMLSVNMANSLTVVSENLQQHFIEKYNKKTIYIPTAVEIPKSCSLNQKLLSKFDLYPNSYYLFMARIVKEKGLHYLIEAFKLSSTNKKLAIAGTIDANSNYHKYLLDIAKSDSRITFIGNISGEVKDTILRGSYVFCQPSEIEGLSVALLEAMSYEKCCIVSDIPENIEATAECCIKFQSKNIQDLCRAIEFADMNIDFVKMQSLNSKKRIEENFTWDIVSSKIENLYFDLMD